MRYFFEVARVGTFTGAAAALNIAQPALWQQVKGLERELGSPLFERWGRRVRLTRHGHLMLERVESVLESAELLRRLARDLQAGSEGLVVVACSQPHVLKFVAGVTGGFRARHPGVDVRLREHPPLPGLPLDDLASAAADVALGTRQPDREGFRAYEVAVVAAVPPDHPWAGRDRVRVEELQRERLLVSPLPSLSRGLLEQAWAAASVRPRIELESPSPATLVAMGEHGMGIPVLADDAIWAVRRGPAAIVVGPAGPLRAEVWLHWRRGTTMSPGLEAFIAQARAAAAITTRSAL